MVSMNFPTAGWGLGYHVSRAWQIGRGSRRKIWKLEDDKGTCPNRSSSCEWLVTAAVKGDKDSVQKSVSDTHCMLYKVKQNKAVCKALSNT